MRIASRAKSNCGEPHINEGRSLNCLADDICARDPIGYWSGVNLFAYVGGNPAIAADPSGLLCSPPLIGPPQVTVAVGSIGVGYAIGKPFWEWVFRPKPWQPPRPIRRPTPKNRTLDHCLDLGEADYDDRAAFCAHIRDRQSRAICYSHCNDNKNEWNNYCRSIYLPLKPQTCK